MRIVIALTLVLAACASPAMQRMQAACDAGDMSACQAVMQTKLQRAQALSSIGAGMQQNAQPAYQPRMQTTCVRQGVFVNCF